MSTLAITAAHFVVTPVRYAVGRWYTIPANTLLAYNAADLGLNILAKSIAIYYNQTATEIIVNRTCATLSALYLTSKLTDPMPLECAMMTILSTITSIFALVALAEWIQGKNNKGDV